MHAALRALELVLECKARRRRRMRVGHLENRGDAAEDCCAAAAFEILLVFVARLTEMHLRVDDARQHMQSPRFENVGRRIRESSDCGNLSAADANVGLTNPVRARNRSATNEEIEHLSCRLP